MKKMMKLLKQQLLGQLLKVEKIFHQLKNLLLINNVLNLFLKILKIKLQLKPQIHGLNINHQKVF